MTEERLSLLTGALEMHGALPALRSLRLQCEVTGVLSGLASAFSGGTSPQLQELGLYTNFTDIELQILAGVLEARARIPGCKRLECFQGYLGWLDNISLAARIRILRALLPSVQDLGQFKWRHGFEACFRKVQAPCLTTFAVRLEEVDEDEDRAVFSSNVLEAAPAVTRLQIRDFCARLHDAAVWHSISEALRHGALCNLLELEMEFCFGGDGNFQRVIHALAGSACSKRLLSLTFDDCGIDAGGVLVLADHLGRDAFPALKELRITNSPRITDVGVVALAEALRKPTQTMLTHLDLINVGMADDGMTALASVISEGRFDELDVLDLSGIMGLTNQGLIASARAIETKWLPVLGNFVLYALNDDQVTLLGISAIAHAVIKGCPDLTLIVLTNSGPGEDHHEMVLGMLEATGRKGKVSVG